MTRDDLREKIANLLWERFGFPEGQAAWHSTGLDVADRILALFPGLIELRAENAHLRQRCAWLQERREALRRLVASRWSKRREVRRLRAKLAAGPVMPEVPSEAVQVLIIDTVNNAVAGRGNWSCYGLYVDIRNTLLAEQNGASAVK